MLLPEKIELARKAGDFAADLVPDEGTCCMDYVWLPRKAVTRSEAAALGLSEGRSDGGFRYGEKGWTLRCRGPFQASKRTVWCKAVAGALHDLGAQVIYVTD